MNLCDVKPKITLIETTPTALSLAKMPSFLSPSSLNQWKGSPNKFVLERLVYPLQPREPQSMAAAAGSSFDYHCKMYFKDELKIDLLTRVLGNMFDKDLKDFHISKGTTIETLMWELNIEPQNRKEALPVGRELFNYYSKNGLASLREAIRDIEMRRTFNLTVNGLVVPLYGILDATIEDGTTGTVVPFDWKVSGYGSAEGKSPKKGYMNSWSDGLCTGSHKDYEVNMPFNLIDADWALQGCTYGWMIGREVLKPFPFIVDMIAIRSHSVKVARYRGIITTEFQQYVAALYYSAWSDIQTGKILDKVGCTRLFAEVLANQERWWM